MTNNNVQSKSRIKRIATSMIALLLITATLMSLVGCGDSIVTENDNGEKVFVASVDEYLTQYNNEVNTYDDSSVSTVQLKKSDFEYADEYEFYALNIGQGMFFLHSDKSGANLNKIFMSIYSDSANLSVGVLCLLRALYPEDPTSDTNQALWDAEDNGTSIYKDVEITCEKNEGLQSWTIIPKE